MSDDPVILAIGADFTRIEAALVHTSGGGVIHREKAVLNPISTGRMSYINPGTLFNVTAQTVKRLTELKPREARRIEGVSLIGRTPAAVLVGADGPSSEFILPEDERFAEAEKRLQFSAAEVYQQVGLTFERCKVPYAAAAAGGAKPTTKVLTPKDYLKWALTGEFSTDALDAQRTFVWDLDKREWSRELCELFGIPMESLPVVLEATAPAGKITAAAARVMGLREGLTVACGMGDWGEYLGSGVYDEGDAFEHIGTTGAFYGVTSRRPAAAAGLDVRPHVKPGLYLTGRQGLPGGECLEWFLRKTSLAAGGVIDWVAVEQELEAASAMAQPENVLFFPNLAGGEGQIDDAAFINLRMEDDLTSFVQGLIEGVFHSLKAVCEEVRSVPWEPKAVFTTGQIGFKHAPKRMRANIYGAPIYSGRTPGANVMAAALAGAVACGVYPTLDAARENMLDLDGGAHPTKATQSLYEAHFASWLGTRNYLFTGGRRTLSP